MNTPYSCLSQYVFFWEIISFINIGGFLSNVPNSPQWRTWILLCVVIKRENLKLMKHGVSQWHKANIHQSIISNYIMSLFTYPMCTQMYRHSFLFLKICLWCAYFCHPYWWKTLNGRLFKELAHDCIASLWYN